MPRLVVVMTPCNSPTVNKGNGALHAGGLGEKNSPLELLNSNGPILLFCPLAGSEKPTIFCLHMKEQCARWRCVAS
ncbi:hypothetical protein TSUD_36220 [Trifolium subterraneum]|uniref:Uncharacterized protein n=1 Tax=Trifolium subterraneum TaxID=3900 RepID=A0A2Z6P479_TRISU|nr:hypothetical protein TSUD_36220 [Trifolium subterraneum]